jgi:CRP-like cAMP-binding protein
MKQLSFEQFTKQMAPEDMGGGSVFGALSIEATRFLLERGVLHELDLGDTLFEPGDPGGRFYVVCKGSLDFFKMHKRALRHIRVVNFGEETGFVPMIALHNQTGIAVAREDSLVIEISAELYAEFQQTFTLDFGLLTLNLAREMARVIDRMGEALIDQTIVR